MNSHQAKDILLLFRPGTADGDDPEFAEALAQTRVDPELRDWFNEHCARHEALRSKFRQIRVPDGLKEQIISERCANSKRLSDWKHAKLGLAVVSVVLLVALGIIFLPARPEHDFRVFESRIPRSVLRQYPKMDLATSDLRQIRAFLMAQGQGNYVLPAGLQKTAGIGCALSRWHGLPVSMICFASGRTATNNTPDLFLFMMERSVLDNPPGNVAPQFKQLTQELAIASWTKGDKVYVLGGLGDQKFLQAFF